MYPKRRLCWRRLKICFLSGWYSFIHSFLSKQNTVAAEAATDNTNNSLSIATCSPRPRQRGLLSISNLLQRKANPGSAAQRHTAQRQAAQLYAALRSAAQRQAAQLNIFCNMQIQHSAAQRNAAQLLICCV